MKENVICGHLIPAGTGLREYQTLIVGDKEELARAGLNTKSKADDALPTEAQFMREHAND